MKPEAVPAMISPPIDWSASAIVLMYQPDPPPETFPSVRSLIKDVNKEKFTLYRYLTKRNLKPKLLLPLRQQSPLPRVTCSTEQSGPACRNCCCCHGFRPAHSAIRSKPTVGTDDQRDRSKLPPLSW